MYDLVDFETYLLNKYYDIKMPIMPNFPLHTFLNRPSRLLYDLKAYAKDSIIKYNRINIFNLMKNYTK